LPHYPHLTEEELLARLAKSDRQAFKQLYVKHYRKIYAYAFKFTRCADIAEDIAQDVFLKVWENRKNMEDVKFLIAYLFKICKNITLNALAKTAREEKIKELFLTGSSFFQIDNESVTRDEEYEKLLTMAIEQLPCQRKQVFRFCKIEGKTYQEVAAILGISTGTINDHIVKATRSIRNYFKEKCIPPHS
jgi:RNA polymerase sigma-70 factor (family 1)